MPLGLGLDLDRDGLRQAQTHTDSNRFYHIFSSPVSFPISFFLGFSNKQGDNYQLVLIKAVFQVAHWFDNCWITLINMIKRRALIKACCKPSHKAHNLR